MVGRKNSRYGLIADFCYLNKVDIGAHMNISNDLSVLHCLFISFVYIAHLYYISKDNKWIKEVKVYLQHGLQSVTVI